MSHSNSDVCDQLMALLGKPRAVNVGLLLGLIDRLEEKPIIECPFEKYWGYSLPKSGISLNFDNELGIFDSFSLELRTFDSEDFKPYVGRLPYGVSRDDSVAVVEAKLPGSTMEIKDYRFDADLRPLVVRFVFLAPDLNAPGLGERILSMVRVDYVDAVRNPAKAASLGYDVRQK